MLNFMSKVYKKKVVWNNINNWPMHEVLVLIAFAQKPHITAQ